jgi:hypothetical protein
MQFDSFLTPFLERRVAVEAAHSALKAITYRDGAASLMEGYRQAAGDNEAADITVKILEAIEKDANRPINALTDAEAERYGRELFAVVDHRIKAENAFDRSVAQARLDDLRNDFSRIS